MHFERFRLNDNDPLSTLVERSTGESNKRGIADSAACKDRECRLPLLVLDSSTRTAGRLFQKPRPQRVLVAFHHASTVRAHSRLTGRQSMVKGGKLALQAGWPKSLRRPKPRRRQQQFLHPLKRRYETGIRFSKMPVAVPVSTTLRRRTAHAASRFPRGEKRMTALAESIDDRAAIAATTTTDV